MTRQTITTFFLSVICLCVLLSTGCGGWGQRAKPKDLPPLYPCTLTFTQDGVPLTEANVVLHSDSKWAVGGKTNEKGEVNLVTNGFYNGAPEGTYKITLRRVVVVMNEATGNVAKQTDVIANPFKRAATTPLEIAIGRSKSENNKTFDVGKAVSINIPVDN